MKTRTIPPYPGCPGLTKVASSIRYLYVAHGQLAKWELLHVILDPETGRWGP